jgi:hypothetical protein
VGLSLFTLSHLPANANFLLLLFAFFLLFFCLNHAEPPLSCITSLWLYVPLVVVRLLAIQPLHEITKRRWTFFEKKHVSKNGGSIIAVQRIDIDRVVHIVATHEEPHPVSMPENLALENLAIVTTLAHRSVDPLRHRNHLFPHGEQLQVQLRTWGSHSELAKQVIVWMLVHEEIQILKQNFNNLVKYQKKLTNTGLIITTQLK